MNETSLCVFPPGGCSFRTGPRFGSVITGGEVTFREGSFQAHLTRSKTIGQDKTITSKPLVIACCFLSHREWLTRGWSLLQGMANFPRDYLMPAHHIARAAESWSSGVMQRLPCRIEFFACLPGMVSHFSTLRQRVFGHLIPAAHSSQALQQLWGSLSPRGTSWEDGVLRRATQSSLPCKIRLWILLQKTNRSVILKLPWNLKARMHLKKLSVSSLWTPHAKMASFLKTQKQPFTQSSQPAQRLWERIPKKPEQPFGHNGTWLLRLSGKKKIKTLHQLGKCYLLPGVDYLDYSCHGVALPTIAFVDYALVK